MPEKTRRSLWEKAGRWLLMLVMAGAPLALGAVHTPVLLVVTGLLALACAALWVGGEPVGPRPAASLVFFVGILLAAVTALQLVPLPWTWLERLAPSNADLWSRCLSPLRETGPASVPISVDPMATRLELVKAICFVLAFLASLRAAWSRSQASLLSLTLVGASLALAAAAVLHPLLGIDKVYGFYAPRGSIDPRHIAPLLNPNHLGAFLNVGICLAAGRAVETEDTGRRLWWTGAAVLLGATQLWVASRGAVAAMLLGLALIALLRRVQAGQNQLQAELVLTAGIGAAGIAMLVLAGSLEAFNELASSDISKLDVARQGLVLVRRFPWFGVGRGAFEATFPSVAARFGYANWTGPENLPVQWVVEWGVPVTCVGLGTLAFAFRPATALARGTVAMGPWAALVCSVVHDLVDFHLEISSVGVAVAVCAGLVVGGPGKEHKGAIHRWGQYPKAIALLSVLSGLVALTFGTTVVGKELVDDRKALREAALKATVGREAFIEQLRAAMLRHPSEPFLPYAGALRAARLREESVLPWVARTLELAPAYGRAHLLLGDELASHAPSQARLEYRLAMEQEPSLTAS
ncbi:MAG: O-antigen ligase family protein, partial [Myxococcales bacterium]